MDWIFLRNLLCNKYSGIVNQKELDFKKQILLENSRREDNTQESGFLVFFKKKTRRECQKDFDMRNIKSQSKETKES